MQIYLENICKRYGRREVVSDVSLNIQQGEIVGLLGPNGAGKTTTFYIMTGLIQPNHGHVWLDDQDITHLPMHRRAQLGIGYLAQEPSIFRRLSIQDNLLLIMEQTGVPRRLWQQRLNQLLEEFRIAHVAHSLGLQVSGGSVAERRSPVPWPLGSTGRNFCCWMSPLRGWIPSRWRIFRRWWPSSSNGASVF